MSETSARDLPLRELLEAVCHGVLTADSAAELEQRVLSDETARRTYVRYLAMHANLFQLYPGEEPAFSPAESLVVKPPYSAAAALPTLSSRRAPGLVGVLHTSLAWIQRPAVFSLIFASAFLFAALTLFGVLRIGTNADPSDSRPAALPRVVARIVASESPQWGAGNAARRGGADLRAGEQLRLRRGLVEIEFAHGARAILQGPLHLELLSADSGKLWHGKLAATVPQQAQGFVVATPDLTVTDLGTEFAVAVDSTGASEVHVFTGQVRLNTSINDRATSQKLFAGDARRYEPASRRLAAVRADRARFITEMPTAIAVEGFNPRAYGPLHLWLRADVLTLRDGEAVTHWPDSSGREFHAVAEEQAPRFRARAIGGKPALEFDGVEDTLRLPDSCGKLAEGLTIFAVVRPHAPPEDARGYIIGKMAGLNNRGFQFACESDGRLIGVSYVPRFGQVSPVESPPVVQFQQPQVWAYVRDAGVQYLFHNSAQVGQEQHDPRPYRIARAPTLIGAGFHTTKPKHFYHGQIAEILVYEEALDATPRQAVESYLQKRYSLPK